MNFITPKGRRNCMDKVKVYYNNESDTMDIWFGNPEDEVICEEAGEGIIYLSFYESILSFIMILDLTFNSFNHSLNLSSCRSFNNFLLIISLASSKSIFLASFLSMTIKIWNP
jgi:hypothetical protein